MEKQFKYLLPVHVNLDARMQAFYYEVLNL